MTLLETWEGPLTWERLVERAALVLGRSYTRQALDGHEAVKDAYQARKQRIRVIRDSLRKGKATSEELPPELALALQRAEAAELRVKALEQTVERYRAKFILWLYNARNAGLTEDQLNSPLPAVDQKAGALWSRRKGAQR
ncbi:MAG TPA: hypothetical protein VNR89_13130 [Roseomonas sp.]|nr:hypothetical protein [Roseomonas sp.]